MEIFLKILKKKLSEKHKLILFYRGEKSTAGLTVLPQFYENEIPSMIAASEILKAILNCPYSQFLISVEVLTMKMNKKVARKLSKNAT